MPKVCYRQKRFDSKRAEQIVKANEIIEEYEAQGFQLNLRQLYYQFVARGLIENNMRSYKNLGSVINEARLAGLIDWLAIEDKTRNLVSPRAWSSPQDIINACASQFAIDKWETQPWHVEVWIEKDALVGVIENICRTLQISYFSCRGYPSQSEVWAAAQRLAAYNQKEKQTLILHLGDHDPSGIDMSRDLNDRLNEFCAVGDIEIRRIALNFDQVQEYDPPPNPCKMTDSRAVGYTETHGEESWELDALEPRVTARLIEHEVMGVRDPDLWEEALKVEEGHQKQIQAVADNWEEICEQFPGE